MPTVAGTLVRAVWLAMDAPRASARVLLVEDEPVLGRIYARALTAAGFAVDLAADGAAGFELVLSNSYDVVVSDLCMPRMNGLDLLAQVRRMRPDVPVVMVTAELDEHAYALARQLGTVRYLRKPITLDQLAHAVESAAMLHASLVRDTARRSATT
jgi:two-component system nitrogen regulation response regulator NtrX